MGFGLLAALLVAASGSAGLADLRQRRDQVDHEQSTLSTRVGEQQAQLESVSKRIDDLKSQRQGSDSPFVSGNLDELLKQSQALSQSLADLRSQSAAIRAEQDEAGNDLGQAIDTRLASDRAALKGSAPSSNLVSEIRALESERASLQAGVDPVAGSPELKFTHHTDDPRELRERADALRDRADKLAKEQARLEARIQELRDQAELDRQLRTLSRKDALFDEGDVHIQAGHAATSNLAASATGGAKQTPTTSPSTSIPTATGRDQHSPLYTGTPLHTPAPPLAGGTVSQTNGLQPNNPAAYASDSAGATGAPTSRGIDPPTHDTSGGSGNSALDSSSSTTAINLFPGQAQVVRPEDFAAHDTESTPIDESSLTDLNAAQSRLNLKMSQLRQQAAALDQQAGQAHP